MKAQLPFDPCEIEGESASSDRWWWIMIFVAVGYFIGRSIISIAFGI